MSQIPAVAEVPLNYEQKLGSEVAETLGLSWLDYITQAVDMAVTLAASGEDSSSYIWQCPAGYDFVVLRIDPLVRSADGSSEATSNDTTLARLQGMRERLFVKALNTQIELVSITRKGEDILNFNTGLAEEGAADSNAKITLGDLDMDLGGCIELVEDGDFNPLFIKTGERIKMTASQSDGTGIASVVGITLWGVMVARPRGA